MNWALISHGRPGMITDDLDYQGSAERIVQLAMVDLQQPIADRGRSLVVVMRGNGQGDGTGEGKGENS